MCAKRRTAGGFFWLLIRGACGFVVGYGVGVLGIWGMKLLGWDNPLFIPEASLTFTCGVAGFAIGAVGIRLAVMALNDVYEARPGEGERGADDGEKGNDSQTA